MRTSSPEPFPGIPEVTVERGVPCRMRDGVTLYADVYRPAEGGPHPVLLMRTPYGKTTAESDVGYAHPSWYARHGYVVVVQDCRGRFASEGDFYPFLHEAEDGYDTVEWAAALPGGDGQVAMYGFSYVGATQLLAATLAPPSLVTICPGFTSAQYYEGWTFNQGAFALALAASWALGLAAETVRRAGDDEALRILTDTSVGAQSAYWSLPLREHPVLARYASYYLDWLEHARYDDYWRRWSIDEDYGRIRVPALHVVGWWDEVYEIITAPADFDKVKSALAAAQAPLLSAQITRLPQTTVPVSSPHAEQVLSIMNDLEDHDDVKEVYGNFEISKEVMDRVRG